MAKAKNTAPKKTKVKYKKTRFYGLNITLQSTERKGAEVYMDLFKKIHDNQMHFVVGHEITMVLRTLHETKILFETNEYPVLYGIALRFNTIKNWYNQKEQIFQEFTPPADLVPNAFETEYLFIPEIHKFFIRYNNRINIYQAKTFIGRSFSELIIAGEKIHVNIITSSDKIDAILSAQIIKSLEATVSYTNDDIGTEAEELIDKMLKESHSGEASINLRPDASGTLDGDSELVKGFIGVAKNNGTVKARIENNGKSETIQTERYPEPIKLEVKEIDGVKEDEKIILFEKMMLKYRAKNKKVKKTNVRKNRRK